MKNIMLALVISSLAVSAVVAEQSEVIEQLELQVAPEVRTVIDTIIIADNGDVTELYADSNHPEDNTVVFLSAADAAKEVAIVADEEAAVQG